MCVQLGCCLQIPSVFTTAEQDSHLTTPGSLRTHAEDFEFSELNFVKSSRMSKRWLLFSCLFFKVCCTCGSSYCVYSYSKPVQPFCSCYSLSDALHVVM